MNAISIIFLVVFCVAVLVVVYFLLSSEIQYLCSLKRNCLAAKIISKYMLKHVEKYKIDVSWWKKVKAKTFAIQSYDGLKLQAYYLRKSGNKIAVIVHGYGANALEMQQYAKMFYDMGYSVLTPDNRGHGHSEGKHITMGYKDSKDVASWVEFLVTKYPKSQIVVFGLSMGGATVCLYSSLPKPKNVKAIVSDCAYTSPYVLFENICDKSIIFTFFPGMKFFDFYLKHRIGFRLTDIDVKTAIKKCNVPILLIHGSRDKFVPFYMRDILYKHAPKKYRHKYTVSGAGHAESLPTSGEEYKNQVKQFLANYISD